MPVDRCNVFFYPRGATTPVLAGELRLLAGLKGSVFRYDPGYLKQAFAVAFEPFTLPLDAQEKVTLRIDERILPGGISDAGPDAWGRKIVDRLSRPERLSEFDYLLAAGPDATGALAFGADSEPPSAEAATLDELADIERAIEQVRRQQPIDERLRHLIAPGGSLGGMRPKTVVRAEGKLWIAKFNARDEDFDAVALECAGMRLAQKAGLSVAEVQKHEFSDRRAALLVSRFDREPIKDGFGRVPYLSARSLLRGYSQEALRESKPKFSYLLLAEARRAVGATDRLRDDLRELYRRMVFNILIDNTDDHESNHGLIFDKGWRFSPAFDVSPQLTRLGYQQMDVGAGGTESSLANALTSPEHFGLAANEAKHLVEQLIDATEAMNNVYREAGVDEQSRERARVHREAVISAFHQRR